MGPLVGFGRASVGARLYQRDCRQRQRQRRGSSAGGVQERFRAEPQRALQYVRPTWLDERTYSPWLDEDETPGPADEDKTPGPADEDKTPGPADEGEQPAGEEGDDDEETPAELADLQEEELKATARCKRLEEEVAALRKELAERSGTHSEMEKTEKSLRRPLTLWL